MGWNKAHLGALLLNIGSPPHGGVGWNKEAYINWFNEMEFAPHTGARVGIENLSILKGLYYVHPHTGVWVGISRSDCAVKLLLLFFP